MQAMLDGYDRLCRCSPYFHFYFLPALRKAGLEREAVALIVREWGTIVLLCSDGLFKDVPEPEITVLSPAYAQGTGDQIWTAALTHADGSYMAQETTGDITQVFYEIPPTLQNQPHSVFLHTRGYYELIRSFEGPPRYAELKRFKDPTYFSDYSRDGYLSTLGFDEHYIANIKK